MTTQAFQKFKTGDRVIVPGWVDGYGVDHSGTIIEVKLWFRDTCGEHFLYTVRYDRPDCEGRRLTVVQNLNLKQ